MDKIDLLHDLERWQACSHSVLAARRPNELFEASFVERYARLQEDLWYRIIRVHGTISTLERLRKFPFAMLYGTGEMEFWRLVVENFIDTAVLVLHSLLNDTGDRVHTLLTFRADIVKGPWLRAEDRELLIDTLRERKFDPIIDSIAARVRTIRHSRIAHRLVDPSSGQLDGQGVGVSLDELRQLFDATHLFLRALVWHCLHYADR